MSNLEGNYQVRAMSRPEGRFASGQGLIIGVWSVTLLSLVLFSSGCGGGWLGSRSSLESLVRVVSDQPLTAGRGDDYLPAWSPDGRQITFTSYRSGNEEIWIMDEGGENPKPLTVSPRGDWAPSWSPDGRWITFTSDRTGTNQIWVMDREGGHLRQLTRPAQPKEWSRDSSWSPDGTRIVYTTNRSGKEENWIMRSDGSNPMQHSRSEEKNCHPSFTPDGGSIIFTSMRTGAYGLWIGDLEGNHLRQLISGPQFDNNLTASLSPDGQWMTYRTGDGNLWLADTTGRSLIQLIKDGSVDGWRVSWSPDGKRIAYTKRIVTGQSTYQTDVWVITLKG